MTCARDGVGCEPDRVLNRFAPPGVPDAELTILLWTDHWFGATYETPLTVLTPHGAKIKVEFVRDHGSLAAVDAVWFHAPTLRDELPPKRPGQPWVLASMEANTHYPSQASQESRRLFDLRMTFHLDSDVPAPYANTHQYGGFRPLPRPPQRPTADVCFIASNPVPDRDAYVQELMEHIPVDSYGACLNNRSFAELGLSGVSRTEEALTTIASYPFYLAFENCREPDYVTEKLYRPLSVGTIPVYWGAPNVKKFIPSPDAALEVTDRVTPAKLATKIRQVASEPGKLARYRAWQKTESPSFTRLLGIGDVDSRARLATKLAHGCGHHCGCGGRQAQHRWRL